MLTASNTSRLMAATTDSQYQSRFSSERMEIQNTFDFSMRRYQDKEKIKMYRYTKFQLMVLIVSVCLLFAYFQNVSTVQAKDSKTGSVNQAAGQQQPLAGFDKILGQASVVRMDTFTDNRMTSNLTNALNEMALNLRKIVVENRRLNTQVQELMSRVQNSTGINATSTIGNLQQQAANLPNLANSPMNLQSLSTLMPRFSGSRR